jgi:hypothetical protein
VQTPLTHCCIILTYLQTVVLSASIL